MTSEIVTVVGIADVDGNFVVETSDVYRPGDANLTASTAGDDSGDGGGGGEEFVPPQFTTLSLVTAVILTTMFVVAFCGNASILFQLIRRQVRRRGGGGGGGGGGVGGKGHSSCIQLLIGNLAVSDLTVTFFCNVTEAVWASTVQWYGGTATCKIVKYVQLLGLYESTFTIVVIGLDRCLAVMDPMARWNARRRVRVMIAASWVLSATLSLPQVNY